MLKKLFLSAYSWCAMILLGTVLPIYADAQQVSSSDLLDYKTPKYYIIDTIYATGAHYLAPKNIIALSGIKKGDVLQLPGEITGKIIKKLWSQKLIEDVTLSIAHIVDDKIALSINIKELPRVHTFLIEGLYKYQKNSIKDKLQSSKGQVLTTALINKIVRETKGFFIKKGYLNVAVTTQVLPDNEKQNAVQLKLYIKKGNRVKINSVNFYGNDKISSKKLRKKCKNLRERNKFSWKKLHINLLSSSKFLANKYEEDKKNLIHYYQQQGYLDATIEKDTIYQYDDHSINIDLTIKEGKRYIIRNIRWVGNYLYNTDKLSKIFSVKKGDIYNPVYIQEKLKMNPKGLDIQSLYMDDGYLNFRVESVIEHVENDSIDIKISIEEGKQFYINSVLIQGNKRTNEHIIRREIRTLPGEKFNRANIIRSQRELIQLDYFDPAKMDVFPTHVGDSLVNLTYQVEEKLSNEDIRLIVGSSDFSNFMFTLRFSCSNFAMRKLFKPKKWNPLPIGDGQQFALHLQSNVKNNISAGFSFVEPWLGGKKYNSLGVYTNYTYARESSSSICKTINLSVIRGKKVTWMDDYSILNMGIAYDYHTYQNLELPYNELKLSGNIYNMYLYTSYKRNSTDNPFFPMKGSVVELSTKVTPPFFIFTPERRKQLVQKQYWEFLEYQQAIVDATFYTKLIGKLVLRTHSSFGVVGNLFAPFSTGPFERFYMGGSGMLNVENNIKLHTVSLRGYEENALTIPDSDTKYSGGIVYQKLLLELRYPITISPQASIYALAFAEAGNNWNKYRDYNLLDLNKSVGVGVRILLPYIGLIGLDWGYGLDSSKDNASHWHLSMGKGAIL